MKYVLDANVAIKWVVDETDSPKARQLRDDYQNGIHELIAPDVFIGECGHTLFTLEHHKKVIQADLLFADLLVDCPLIEESLNIVSRAAAIVKKIRCNFYDALYVALAEENNIPLITADHRLINGCQHHYRLLVDLATLP